jgi:uncharacterized protein YdeI (YjbR/CyaY-like superfamily)
MKTLNPKVDQFIADGCGRCKFHATPKCKVNRWRVELETLRQLVNDSGLKEELKWGFPCYTYENKNVLMIGAFKEYCSLNFFKGMLLKDAKKLLEAPGENSKAVKSFRFKDISSIVKNEKQIKSFITEAIQLEKTGAKIEFKKSSETPVPEEFEEALKKNAILKKAFNALTPGRQRGYLLFFSQPKQSKTRESRIEKCKKDILNGKGLNDF